MKKGVSSYDKNVFGVVDGAILLQRAMRGDTWMGQCLVENWYFFFQIEILKEKRKMDLAGVEPATFA